MSTKIYNAYRVRRGVKLKHLIQNWHKQGTQNVYYRMRQAASRLDGGIKELKEKYLIQSKTMLRSKFDFNGSITFRFSKGRIYVQVFEGDGLVTIVGQKVKRALDFVGKDSRIEDYHYQNSSDRPEYISDREWKARRDKWDELYGYEDQGRSRFLSLTLMDQAEFVFFEINEVVNASKA
jgi:hypothetical protein